MSELRYVLYASLHLRVFDWLQLCSIFFDRYVLEQIVFILWNTARWLAMKAVLADPSSCYTQWKGAVPSIKLSCVENISVISTNEDHRVHQPLCCQMSHVSSLAPLSLKSAYLSMLFNFSWSAKQWILCINRLIQSIMEPKVELCSLDGRGDGEHMGVGLMEMFTINAMQGDS